jgi:hypothetical protein
MSYYIDLKSISIDQYKKILQSSDLIPSWKALLEDIDNMFNYIKKQNLNNLEELLENIKNKDKVQKFAKLSGMPLKYLEVLRRSILTYKPAPNKIRDFQCVSKTIVDKLESVGIKNTIQLYDKILTTRKRKELFEETDIKSKEIEKLAKLTDLSRIK